MQQIYIISVGKLNNNFKIIASEYLKMIKWKVHPIEITYSKKMPIDQIKQFEAKEILKYLHSKSYKIALDVKGQIFDSFKFANIFNNNDRIINFIIGGAYGLDSEILHIADLKISLSNLTFPHQMAKIMLFEQIYRAQTILENHPYHK